MPTTQSRDERIRALAQSANLELSDEHARGFAMTLLAWIEDANELSSKMSAPEHLERIPITVFSHAEG